MEQALTPSGENLENTSANGSTRTHDGTDGLEAVVRTKVYHDIAGVAIQAFLPMLAERSSRTAISSIAVALIAVMIVAALVSGVVFLDVGSSTSHSITGSARSTTITTSNTPVEIANSTTSTSVEIATPSASEYDGSAGLSLDFRLSTNSSGYLTVVLGESNLYETTNLVLSGNSWRISPRLLDPNAECSGDVAVGFAIFQGFFTESNYTGGKPLTLYDSGATYQCSSEDYSSFSLPPLGQASWSYSTDGYWTGGVSGATVLQRFPEGVYTVIAADEWGRLLVLHFSVAADTSDHTVTFQQIPNECGSYVAPWSVTFGSTPEYQATKVEPPNGTVSMDGFETDPYYANYSTITFAEPDGYYNYRVSPPMSTSGVIIVNGTDVTVQVNASSTMSCGPEPPKLVTVTISSPGPVMIGSRFNLTATVAGARDTPNGTISWSASGEGNLSSDICTLSPRAGSSGTSACSVTFISGVDSLSASQHVGGYQTTVNVSASYSGDPSYPPASSATSLVIALPLLTVNTENTSGRTIYGYTVVLSNAQDGTLASAFSSANWFLNSGQQYSVEADDFNSCHFDYWADTHSTSRIRTVSITSDTLLIAVYNCGA
jgi:hypothetical protein